MSKAFKCDCCGKYFDFNNEEFDEIIIRHGTPTRFKGIDTPRFTFKEERLECCHDCINAVREVLTAHRGNKE